MNEDWIPSAEESIPLWLQQRIVGAATVQYNARNYRVALNTLKRANDLCPGEPVDALTAKCLAHLHHARAALALIPKLRSSDAWTTKVDIYEALGMNDRAVKVCDSMGFGEPMLRKAALLAKQGKRQLAIETAKNARWHAMRELKEIDKFDAVLKKLGIAELTEPPRITSSNDAVFHYLATLINLKQPETTAQLQEIFHRPFSVGGLIIPDSKFPTLNCVTAADGPFVNIQLARYSAFRLGKDENALCVRLNLDRSFVTNQQIREFLERNGIRDESFIEHEPLVYLGAVRNVSGPDLSCECKDSRLEFAFLKTGQLASIIKYWKKSPAELEEVRQRNVPHNFTDGELTEAESQIALGKYSKAAESLLFRFNFYDRTPTPIRRIMQDA